MPETVEGCFANRVRTGRKMIGNERVVGVTNVSQNVFPANPRRVRLIINSPTANRITIAFGKPAVDIQGHILPANLRTETITIENYGIDLTGELNVIQNAAGPTNVWFREVILNDT